MPDMVLDTDNATENKVFALVNIPFGKKDREANMIKCKAMVKAYMSTSLTTPVSPVPRYHLFHAEACLILLLVLTNASGCSGLFSLLFYTMRVLSSGTLSVVCFYVMKQCLAQRRSSVKMFMM